MASLTRTEARLRSDLLTVERMEVDLDLDQGADRFGSRTTIRFRCAQPGASTFLDVLSSQVTLNQARSALIQARFDARVAKAQIETLTGKDM